MNKIIAIAMLAALSACTSMDQLGLSEDKYQHSWVEKNLIVGKTTMEDVRRIYGEPYGKSGNGLNDTWYYRSVKRQAGVALVQKAQGAILSRLPGAGQAAAGTATSVGGPVVQDSDNSQILRISFKRGFYDSYY